MERFGNWHAGSEAVLSGYDFRKWAPATFDYDEFDEGIKAAVRAPICPGCRRGGGNPERPMRRCSSDRGLEWCVRCSDFNACPHAAARDDMRSGAAAAGLMVESRGVDAAKFLAGSQAVIEYRWPASILFTAGPETDG